jgi:hypothetical protein
MPRGENFQNDASIRTSQRENLAKNGPVRRPKTAKKSLTAAAKAQKRWLTRIGRGGRAVLAAINYARDSIRHHRAPLRRRPDGEEPFTIQMCNDPKQRTKAWVIYERLRSEREADRRRGRFVAFRLEDVKLPQRVLRKHGL